MGCGTCIGMCPNSCLELRKNESLGVYFPEFKDNSRCRECRLCLEVCPGQGLNFDKLNNIYFGKTPDNVFVGNFINCYTGYSTDSNIRFNSSSGGIATALLIAALQANIVDAVLLTRMKKNQPSEPEPFLAKSKEEILEAMGSKYCPVPLNIGLNDILKKENKVAVVGLPCHIQGIRLAELKDTVIKKKILLHLGLFCGLGVTFKATESLLKRLRIDGEDVEKLCYRTAGWPGNLSVDVKNKEKVTISYADYWNRNFVAHSLRRCTLCSDSLSELADISLGDAWLSEYKEDRLGRSLIITRNKIGEDLLHIAGSLKMAECKNINSEKVIQAQKNILFFKKKSLYARISIFKILRQQVPVYRQKLLGPNLKDYLDSVVFYAKRFIFKLI